MSSDSVPLRRPMTRDVAGTLLGQTMGLVAVTAGLFAVGTSHWVHHDEPERVTQLLIDFFAPALPTENR
jgi:hypothetical protein